jgi:hypothetical protein
MSRQSGFDRRLWSRRDADSYHEWLSTAHYKEGRIMTAKRPRNSGFNSMVGILAALVLLQSACDQSVETGTVKKTDEVATTNGSTKAGAGTTIPGTETPAANPVSAAQSGTKAPPKRTNGAMFYAPESTIDFGPVADYETRTAVVKFVNQGDQTLEVTRVQPTCGCTTTALKQKLFAPGEGSEIELTFKPKGSGNQTKLVKVHTNDSINPVHTIMIKAKVSASVSATPKSLSFGEVDLGTGGDGFVILTAEDDTYAPTSTRVAGNLKDYATATVESTTTPGARKKTWRVRVTLKPGVPWGWHTGSLQIIGSLKDPVTGEPRSKTVVVGMNASVEGRIRADDTIFRMMILKTDQDFTKTLKLEAQDGKPFEILSTTVTNARPDNMVVAVTPVAGSNGSAYEITLAGRTGPVNTSILGQVELTTDVPGEENLAIRIAGSVRK